MFGLKESFPDIIWDGYVSDKIDDPKICIKSDTVEVLNVDQPNKNKNPRVEREPYACSLEPLPSITLTALN